MGELERCDGYSGGYVLHEYAMRSLFLEFNTVSSIACIYFSLNNSIGFVYESHKPTKRCLIIYLTYLLSIYFNCVKALKYLFNFNKFYGKLKINF